MEVENRVEGEELESACTKNSKIWWKREIYGYHEGGCLFGMTSIAH